MAFSKPLTELVQQRFSCRDYLKTPIDAEKQERLAEFIATNQTGPFGSPTRFELVAATEADRKALRGLSTYGYIKNPTGFILGAMGEGEKNLEDFGYAMERIILCATDLGLGTCWLGGSFTKSQQGTAQGVTESARCSHTTRTGMRGASFSLTGRSAGPFLRTTRARTPYRSKRCGWGRLLRTSSLGGSSKTATPTTFTSSAAKDTARTTWRSSC